MPKNTKKASGSKASSSLAGESIEVEVFASRLWTVTNSGGLFMPSSSPPGSKDESLGAYWEVVHCGDRGGPANKVRELCCTVDSLDVSVFLCVRDMSVLSTPSLMRSYQHMVAKKFIQTPKTSESYIHE